MSDDAMARVHYFPSQYLRTGDFVAEQQYHLAMRRRHNIAHHSWGVVAGLRLSEEGNELWLEPGLAIDGYGRELVVSARQKLALDVFAEKNTDQLGVWLVYRRIATDAAPKGYAGCGAEGAGSTYRWQEQGWVRLDKLDPSESDTRRPRGVPPGDWEFDPSRTPPDDPERGWPVFLGTILRERPNPRDPTSWRYLVAPDGPGVPYAGLIGERIVAPSGRACLQLGAETSRDPRRFALFIKDPERPEALSAQPSLAVGKDGAVELRGSATVRGDLTVAAGGIAFVAGELRLPRARPWQIYQVCRAGAAEANELRIEMPYDADGQKRVVIGAWSADEQTFKPCLTVAANQQVTVHGDLVIEGLLSENQARSVPKITPQVRALALSTALDTLNREIFPPTTNDVEAFKRLLRSGDGQTLLVGALTSGDVEADDRRQFIAALVANEASRTIMIDALFNTVEGQRAVRRYLLEHGEALAGLLAGLADDSAGRAALSATIAANNAARETVLAALLNTGEGQRAVVAQVLSDGAALVAVVRDLLAVPAGREAFGAALLQNSAALDAVLAAMLAGDAAQGAVVRALLRDGAALGAVLKGLAGNAAGRAAISEVAREHTTLRDAVLDTLLTSGDGRNAVLEALGRNPDALGALLRTLAGKPEGRAALSAVAREHTALRDAILASLLQRSEGQQAVFAALVADAAALEAVIRRLAADGQARAAFNTVLVTDADARTAVIDSLVKSADGLATLAAVLQREPAALRTLIGELARDAPGQAAIIAVLLGSSAVRDTILAGLLESPDGKAGVAGALGRDLEALGAVVEQVAGTAEGQAAIIRRLLASEAGRAAVATELVRLDSGLDAVKDLLLENTNRLRDLLRRVLGQAAAGQAVAEEAVRDAATRQLAVAELLKTAPADLAGALLSDPVGARGLAVSLQDAGLRKALVDMLKTADFTQLRSDLRDELA